MNKSEIIALYTQDQRKSVTYPDARRDVTPTVIRHVDLSDNGEGTIIYSQLDEANADEVIREQIDYFADLGRNFEWKLYDYDKPTDLKERLEKHGFAIEEEEAIMVLDVDNAPEFLLQPVAHDIRRIVKPENLDDVQTIEEKVWNEDHAWIVDFLGDTIRNHPKLMSVYAAYMDDQPASAAWIYFPDDSQFASLWGGSTVEEFRGKGLYSALLAIRLQEAKQRQVKYLTVDASPMSRPILEKFGFEMIALSYPCKWETKSKDD